MTETLATLVCSIPFYYHLDLHCACVRVCVCEGQGVKQFRHYVFRAACARAWSPSV